MSALPGASLRRVCRLLSVPRSQLHPPKRRPAVDASAETAVAIPRSDLPSRIKRLITQHPTFGYRRIWALLRFREGVVVSRKTVYCVLKRRGWFVHQRQTTPRPRVQAKRSRVATSNTRWAMDVTHIDCGRDGWGHLTAVIDCCDREIIGYEFALRGRAREAERAIEAACISRFGSLRPAGPLPVIRSDNGLIFQSTRFRTACRAIRLSQEFITPYNARTERHDRAVLPQCQGRVYLAAHLRLVCRGQADPRCLDRLVQHRAAASGIGLSQPEAVSRTTTSAGGLISGETGMAPAPPLAMKMAMRDTCPTAAGDRRS